MSRYYTDRVRVYKFQGAGLHDETNYIELDNITSWSVREGIGKVKDTFGLEILNSSNKYYDTYHSGDGNTKDFTWYWATVDFPEGFSSKVEVYIDGVQTTAFTLQSGGVLRFTSAPATGTNNIRIRYPVIEYEDRVEIHQVKDSASIDDNDDLVIAGIVNDINGGSTESNRTLSVSGVGLIEIFFNTLVFVKPEPGVDNGQKTAPAFIQDIISQLNSYNRNREITWAGNNVNSKLKAFSPKTYYANYKRGLDILEELSGDQYTDDGVYYYYVNYDRASKKNYLYWKPKVVTSTGTTLIEGVDIFTLKFDLTDEKVVNAIIYNCGSSPAGYGIEKLYIGSDATTFNQGGGTKWYYMTETSSISDNILNNEFTANPSQWDVTDDGNRSGSYPNAYPYTFIFRTRDASYNDIIPAAFVTVSSDAEFNDAVIFEAEAQGYSEADRLYRLYSQAVNRVDVSLPFESPSNYVKGDIVTITAPSFGLKSNSLRIIEKTTERGTILIKVEEDEATLI